MNSTDSINMLQEFSSQLSRINNFIIDLDGVVYEGRQEIPGAIDALNKFAALGKQIIFLTNNSASTTLEIHRKLLDLGFNCLSSSIVTSAQSTALVIRKHHLDEGLGVYVIGCDGLKQELNEAGIKITTANACGAVVVGIDFEFNYKSIATAVEALQRPIPLICCNRDPNFPGANSQIMPGCGSIIASIEIASNRKADWEIGKPNTIMLDIIFQRFKISADDCLIIGDRLDSDIMMAARANLPSILITPSEVNCGVPSPSFQAESLEIITKQIFAI
jgi:arabinose operon protein AraL